jgi:hypothetical protein
MCLFEYFNTTKKKGPEIVFLLIYNYCFFNAFNRASKSSTSFAPPPAAAAATGLGLTLFPV